MRDCEPGSFLEKVARCLLGLTESVATGREYASYSTGKFSQCIIEQRKKHMEERNERDAPEVRERSFLGRQAVDGEPAHTESREDREIGSESIPHFHLPMPDLQ